MGAPTAIPAELQAAPPGELKEQAGAPSPQEPEAPPEGEELPSGAEGEEQEAADPQEAFLEALRGLKESDPELAKKLQDEFAQEQPEARQQILDWQLQQSKATRQQALTQASQRAAQYTGDAALENVYGWASELAGYVRTQAEAVTKKAADEGKAEVSDFVDAATLTQHVADYAQQAVTEWDGYLQVEVLGTLLDTLDSTVVRRQLTQDDGKAISAAFRQPTLGKRVAALVAVYVERALQSAPEEIQRRATKKAEVDTGRAKALAEALKFLPKNSRVPVGGGGGGTPRNETEARNLHATGKWTNQQMREYLARNGANE